MDESNSSLDPSTHEDPNSTQVPRVHTSPTQDTEKFLAYVKGRREAFEYASEMLRSHSENLAIRMKQFEQSVLNNRPLEQLMNRTCSFIDLASSEIIDILQPPSDRLVSRSAATSANQYMQKLQFPDQKPSDSAKPRELTTDVVQCVNELMNFVTDAVESGDGDVAEIAQYQGLIAESDNENAGQNQDGIENGVQSALTNASSKYGDILTCSWKEFFEKVPWMRYIIHEVKQKRRWKSMSDLDEFRKMRDKEEREKAKKEEEAKMAEQQRALDEYLIEARADYRLDYVMNWRVVNFFVHPPAETKNTPPFPPALNEYVEYTKCKRGGLRVDIAQYLRQRIKNSNDPEKLAFYSTLQKYMRTPMVSSFVQFMHNKWKTGKVLKMKENAFVEELKEWIESIWTTERSIYLKKRREGAGPEWAIGTHYNQYLQTKCPKYYETDFFKSRMRFHMLNNAKDPVSDFLALHYTFLDEHRVDDEILDRDFYVLQKCAPLERGFLYFEKAFFMTQIDISE